MSRGKDHSVLNEVLKLSEDFAVLKGHETLSKIHILHTIISIDEIRNLLVKCGVDFEKLVFLDQEKINSQEVSIYKDRPNYKPTRSEDINRIISMSEEFANHHNNIGIELFDVLFSLTEFKDSEEHYMLMESGLDLDLLKKEIQNNKKPYCLFQVVDPENQQLHRIPNNKKTQESVTTNKTNNKASVVDQLNAVNWVVNYNEYVKKKAVDPLIGREDEVQKVIYSISKRKKSNAVLVGEPGVGKTAIVEGLAQLINAQKVPDSLKNSIIFGLDISGLVSGTKYRGDLEQKVNSVLNLIKNETNIIIFIDEIHSLFSNVNANDLSNIFKPLLSSGQLKFIGATTYQEFRQYFEKDAAFNRRFEKIDIEEPSIENSIKILQGLKSGYEQFHKVKYSEDAIESAVNLSIKHINGKFLPDKAIDVIDEAGTFVKFNPEYNGVVSKEVVQKIISKMTRIPEMTMSEDTKNQIEFLDKNLKSVIFGQNEAIDKIVDIIQLGKAGFNNPNKPLGSFMFAGPTGVGKTDLTNQLSKQLGMNLCRLDMSEFKEAHTVSRLIGSPPGYVGSNQDGQLTGAVLKQPNSIILLDEMEKAHPEILDLLLQVLDHGTLTDSQGRKANFRQSIIICTTNTGSAEINRAVIGLNQGSIEQVRDPMGIIKNSFRPEFLNRFDSIIWFNSLTKENVRSILMKHVKDVESTLMSKNNSSIILDEKVQDLLINKGYSPEYGARQLDRVFQNEIKKPLAKELLFGQLQKPSKIMVSVEDGKINFNIKPLKVKVSKKIAKEVIKNE